MIVSFADEETRKIFRTVKSRNYAAVARAAARRLGDIDCAKEIGELNFPPRNRLERLRGDRGGQWSICVNDQFRICFEWNGTDASNVELVDFH